VRRADGTEKALLTLRLQLFFSIFSDYADMLQKSNMDFGFSS